MLHSKIKEQKTDQALDLMIWVTPCLFNISRKYKIKK